MKHEEIEKLNTEDLNDKRKSQLIGLLVDAILNKQVLFTKEQDKKLGGFMRDVCAMKRGKNDVKVKPIIFLLANTVDQALNVHGRKYCLIKEITDKGVYGIGIDERV